MVSRIVFGLQLFATGLAGIVAWQAAQQRHAPGARAFTTVMAAVSAWALLSVFESHPLFHRPLVFSALVRANWLPIGVVGVAWLAFALAYTGREALLTRRRLVALSVVPAVTATTAFCHGILLTELEELLGPYDGLVGPLWAIESVWPLIEVIGAVYTYLLVAVGSLLLLEVIIERPFPHPGQLLIVLIVGPPWLLNAAQVTVLRIAAFDPTVLGFAISGLVGLVAIGRFKLLDVPLARARVVEEIDSGVLVYGRDGTVYDYNERAASLLALSPDVLETDVRTVLADSALELAFPASVAPRATSHEQTTGGVPGDRTAAVSDGGVDSLAAYLDGRTVAVEGEDGPSYLELQLSDLHDAAAGQPSRVVLLYDVSDRERRKRALEEKNEFLDEFASVVSHDVATPLGVIENKARLVEVTGDPSHAADIYEATERVQALVDELRNLAREGVQVGETTTVDLETVAHEAWTSVESTDAALTVADSRTVEADRSRLRQLFENLFRNAVDHATGDESVEIEVKTTASSFSVADDGPGIPRSEREQVFEQGYTTTEDGSGLGLAIVRRIVEGHGWTVRATESDAGGARFVVDTE